MSSSMLGMTKTPILASESDKNDDADDENEDLNLELDASDEENNVNPGQTSQDDPILNKSEVAEHSSPKNEDRFDDLLPLETETTKRSPLSLKDIAEVVVEEKGSLPKKQTRRCALISTKRKSPIKNGCSKFEKHFDTHNLDKNRSSKSTFFLDEDTNSLESDKIKQASTSAQEETGTARRSPRKHKRKASISPKNSKRKKVPLLSGGSKNKDEGINESDQNEERGAAVKCDMRPSVTSKPKEKEIFDAKTKQGKVPHEEENCNKRKTNGGSKKEDEEKSVSNKKGGKGKDVLKCDTRPNVTPKPQETETVGENTSEGQIAHQNQKNQKRNNSLSKLFIFQNIRPFGEFDD